MATTATPLRYPGGKSRLARFFSFLLRQNKISDCIYIEPFAGGAGAGINLLRMEYVRLLYLNDIDTGVHAFWYSLLYHTEELCRMVEEAPLTMEEWHRQKEVLGSPTASPIDLGFAVLFMNRTNRSGIITGGVIGGQKQTGKWKIDARFNRVGLVEKIRRIAGYRHRIKLFCMDARDFLSNVVAACQERIFIYLDPPYYRKGRELYENNYGHDDHSALAQALKALGEKPWVVSYNNVPEIREVYSGLPHLTYGINYSASERYEGKEIMFFGPTIKQPRFKNPLSIKHYA
jgi:DNA adenine methylase